jgi:hypothetical protein
MLSWWTDMDSVASLNDWLLLATLVFAALTGVMVFLNAAKARKQTARLSKALGSSRKRIKSLEKTAESIRKELLETQQHQDISQLKLKTSDSSAEELRQELLAAKKRLIAAEAAIKARKEEVRRDGGDPEDIQALELELEPELEPELEIGLAESQREQLIDLLDPGPKGNIDIFCVIGDEGSQSTASQLDEIMTNDGWKTNGVAQSAFSNPPQGIVLAVNSKETAPSYASFLQRVFSTIGIPVSAKFDSKYREWSLTVIVGTVKG